MENTEIIYALGIFIASGISAVVAYLVKEVNELKNRNRALNAKLIDLTEKVGILEGGKQAEDRIMEKIDLLLKIKSN